MNPATAGSERNIYTSIQHLAVKIAWPMFLVLLPVTSFPYFPRVLGGGAIVRPLALYPLILLVVFITIPALIHKPFPKTFISLIPFITIAIASSLISLTIGIEPIMGISISERVIRNLLTLAIGVAIFCTASILPGNNKQLEASLRWVYIGGAAALLWGTLQAVYVVSFNNAYYQALNWIQSHFSTRKLIDNRISGFTYEPNWFAEQIVLLLLPFLIASLINRRSVFRWKWEGVTIEKIIMVWAVALLPFTYSRAGLLNIVLLAFASIALAGLTARLPGPVVKDHSHRISGRRQLLSSAVLILFILVILAGLMFFAGTRNTYFARIWEYWQRENPTLAGYMDGLGFGARLAYGEAAINTYREYPFIGVGLGNYAFYFEQMLPERPISESPELLHLIVPERGRNRLITSKIFFLRLLAETGIVGMVAFIAFLIAMIGCALYLWLSKVPPERYWGTAGLLGLFSFLIASLSFDSFAIPNMWIVFGFITCSTWLATRPANSISETDFPKQ
jgi:hypothetical protein